MCSREAAVRRRGVRELSPVDDCVEGARGVLEAGTEEEGFWWDRIVAAGVGVGRLERGKGRRDEGFGMPLPLIPRLVVVALLACFSSMLAGRDRRVRVGLVGILCVQPRAVLILVMLRF